MEKKKRKKGGNKESAASYSLATAIWSHNQGQRFEEFNDIVLARTKASNPLDEKLVDGGHLLFRV